MLKSILATIGNVVLSLLGREAVKQIIRDKVTALAKDTDNAIDDQGRRSDR